MSRIVLLVEAIAPLTLTSSILSVLTAVVYNYVCTGLLEPVKTTLLLLGIVLLHVGINLYNDYRDYATGVDEAYRRLNVIHRLNMIIDLGVDPTLVKRASLCLLVISSILGLTLIALSRAVIALAMSILGVVVGYLYSVYLRRAGIGEILAGLAVGPGVVIGALDVLNNLKVDLTVPLIIGLVNGLYTTIILTLIALARLNVDSLIGKRTIAVILGEHHCKKLLYALIGLIFTLSMVLAVYIHSFTPLITLVLIPVLLHAALRYRIRRLFYCRVVHVGILILSLVRV